MSVPLISSERAQTESVEQLFRALESSPAGLNGEEARARLQACGPNALEEHRSGALRKLLAYFWGPFPWMIEIAAVLSFVVRHWADLVIIVSLLVINALIGFSEEFQAGNAVAALKAKLALRSRGLRDGRWQELPAQELVPGDVIRLRMGDIIPADVKLIEGDYLSIDQSTLTGESLPIDKKVGNVAYAGSIAKQGEMLALVTTTGEHTYFGKTTKLVEQAKPVSHFRMAVLRIGHYLIYLSIGLVLVVIGVQLSRGASLLQLAEFALLLVVASIPVALPAVFSVTMAIGALELSRRKAIVTRLESIEEMAGMDLLCADKTGTLTQNRLTLKEPVAWGDPQALLLAGALASKAENQDPIDRAVLRGLEEPRQLEGYAQERFVPFDPVSKRTEATVKPQDGPAFRVSKGAPQVVLALCRPEPALETRVNREVARLARTGDRTLGVARSDDGASWTFLGLLPLSDPPREDAAELIVEAKAHGLRIKMVTGDNLAIAREIAGRLGLSQDILPAGDLFEGKADPARARRIEEASGFAQVFPEHKYAIVKSLQAHGHIVGMTGDGVNDAPALKQANVGIAVSGATDAARAAAALVLTEPGLSTIIRAVEEARRIFERMNSYAIYRATETIRIMCFITLVIVIYGFYPITAIMIILLALLNDLPIMAIAFDNTWLDPRPVRWDMRRVLTVATVLGGIGVLETFGLLVLARSWLGLDVASIQSLIFLKLAVAGHLTLFVARTRRPFFTPPYPAPLLLGAILATQCVAAMIVGFGWFVKALPWTLVGFVWLYCLVWVFIEDWAKQGVYRFLDDTGPERSKTAG